MRIGDLIAELKKFPELSSVFLMDERGKIFRLGDTVEVWVKEDDGLLTEVAQDADDYGILLV